MTVNINVNFNFEQLKDAVKQLTPKEKLQINEVLWEDNLDIPIEHQNIVLERMESARQNPERLLDWDKVSKNI